MVREREARRLVDYVDGREGTFVKTVGAEANDPNLDAVRVKYYPDVDLFKSPVYAIKLLLGLADPVISDTIFPRDAVRHDTMAHPERGVPEKVVKLLENQHGEAPLVERDKEWAEESIARNQSRAEDRKRSENIKDMDNIDKEDQEQRRDWDKDRRRDRRDQIDELGQDRERGEPR